MTLLGGSIGVCLGLTMEGQTDHRAEQDAARADYCLEQLVGTTALTPEMLDCLSGGEGPGNAITKDYFAAAYDARDVVAFRDSNEAQASDFSYALPLFGGISMAIIIGGSSFLRSNRQLGHTPRNPRSNRWG